jgi:hypothetical protein
MTYGYEPNAGEDNPISVYAGVYEAATGNNFEKDIRKYIQQHGSDVGLVEFATSFPGGRVVSKGIEEEYFRRYGKGANIQALYYTEIAFWHLYRFIVGGKKEFRVSPVLGRLLNDTDLNVPDMYLNPPFPGMYLKFEGDVIQMETTSYGLRGMEGLYFNSERIKLFDGSERDGYRLFMVSSPYGDRTRANDETVIPHGLGGSGRMITEEDVKQWVRESMVEYSEDAFDRYVTTISLVLKTLAYINSGGADLLQYDPPELASLARDAAYLPPREARKVKEKLARAVTRSYILVGSRLAPVAAEEAVISGPGSRRLTYRHMVRGHFRAYWMRGDRLTDKDKARVTFNRSDGFVRVLKWLKPFLRGPESADVVHRDYHVLPPEEGPPPEQVPPEGPPTMTENPWRRSF